MSNVKNIQARIALTKGNELVVKEMQNPNIKWSTGVDGEKIWMGRIEVGPNAKSSILHHKESETVHYLLSGKAKVYYGNNYENTVELDKGDFIYIPPYHAYVFENMNDKETVDFVTFMAPEHQIVYVERNEEIEVPANIAKEEVVVVRASELDDSTDQTKNMPRRTGIQSANIWIGRVTGEPATDSGAHHHGEAETGGFIISGTTRILHGENYEDYAEFVSGDFVHVPPYAPHIERNMSTHEPVEFLTARNPRNIVVNLED